MDKPKYKLKDNVTFECDYGNGKVKLSGYVFIVDPNGTFEQSEEPSYDIMVEEGLSGLHKHIRESMIIGLCEVE